jgi:hypothetical protein
MIVIPSTKTEMAHKRVLKRINERSSNIVGAHISHIDDKKQLKKIDPSKPLNKMNLKVD